MPLVAEAFQRLPFTCLHFRT